MIAGVSGGLYLLTRDWQGSSETQEADPGPAAQQQQYDSANPEVRKIQYKHGAQLDDEHFLPVMAALLRHNSQQSPRLRV